MNVKYTALANAGRYIAYKYQTIACLCQIVTGVGSPGSIYDIALPGATPNWRK